MIDLPENDLLQVKRILREHIPDYQVKVFGSRIQGIARRTSDLDLAVAGEKKLPLRTQARLREAFEESTLSFCVDIVDLNSVSSEFKKIIEAKCETLQP